MESLAGGVRSATTPVGVVGVGTAAIGGGVSGEGLVMHKLFSIEFRRTQIQVSRKGFFLGGGFKVVFFSLFLFFCALFYLSPIIQVSTFLFFHPSLNISKFGALEDSSLK